MCKILICPGSCTPHLESSENEEKEKEKKEPKPKRATTEHKIIFVVER